MRIKILIDIHFETDGVIRIN